MHRLARITLSATAALALAASAAYAQSSGNVATDELTTVGQIATTPTSSSATYTCYNPANGASVPCPTGGSNVLLSAPIQVSSGTGNAILITPSLDTGLYTNTTVSGTGTLTGSDGETTGVLVTVLVCNSAGSCSAAQPEVQTGTNKASGVMYDQRFQYLATNNIQCGGVAAPCDLQLVQNTLSAHSFNFYYPVPGQDTYTVKAYATLANPSAQSAACIGPATLSAVQVKAFSQN